MGQRLTVGSRFAIVMAGGSGTRFWPASRASRPKQFLPLGRGGESLLQAAVRRAGELVGQDHVRVVAAARHAEALREQLPGLGAHQLLLEPIGRNTAPCLGWASAHLRRVDPTAVAAALPADTYVGDEPAFFAAARRAFAVAEAGPIATLGLRPTRAETGYGYLEPGEPLSLGASRLRAFIEKPDAARARAFVEAGHLWNSGMFFFRVDALLAEIALQLPALAAFLSRWEQAAEQGAEGSLVEREFASLPAVSIDHGVMEKARDVAVVPAEFGWHDIGSWAAAWELADKDARGNALPPGALAIDAHDCYAHTSGGKLVVLLGTRDLVIVDTPDALLVAPRERSQELREVVERLRKEGREDEL